MSRLQELIAELCPDGVEYKALGELGSLLRGKRFVRNDFVEQGTPCIHYGELYTHYGVSASEVISHVRDEIAPKLRYAQPGDVIIVGAGETVEDIGLGVAWLGDVPVAVHDACYTLHQDLLDPVFVSYFLRTDDFHLQIRKYIGSSKVSSVSSKGLAKARIPVPPIEVQREVVRVLDEYTAAHDELVRQLEEEMGLREQQLSVVRDDLFDFNSDTKMEPLGSICSIRGRIGFRGYTKADIVPAGEGAISLSPSNIVGGQLFSEKSTYVSWDKYYESPEIMVSIGDVLFVKTGSTVGKVAFVDTLPCHATINPQMIVMKDFASGCDPRFISHYLQTSVAQVEIQQMAGVGSVPNISQKRFASIEVPLPSIEVQEKIVEELDMFLAAHKELMIHLASEFELQDGQLSHVRNQLLSFPEKAV